MNNALSIENRLKDAILDIIIELGYGDNEFEIGLEKPKQKENGDYSTNTAMKLTKLAKKAPRIIAEEIISKLNKNELFIERIEIAGPGFINFYMDNNYLTKVIGQVLKEEGNYGNTNFGQNKTVNVEFVSANPTGDLHLGHARGAAIGDCLCRILSKAGFDVTREYYINDAGMQIHNLGLSTEARYLQLYGKDVEMPKDGYYAEDIIDIAKSIQSIYGDKFLNDEDRFRFIKNYALNYELEKIKRDLEDYRVKFDVWSSEKVLYENNKVQNAIETLREKGYVYNSEGAVWFKSTEFGDDKDRVLQKSDGTLTYLTPDITYHIDKLSRGYDKLINILGADHHGYIPRLKAAIQALGHTADKLEVDIIQMVRLMKSGEEYKMSKRTGNAVTIRELSEEVGTDAVRYFFAMRSADTQMDFDIDLAKSQSSDNPVFYAQYAHARMASILRQAEDLNINYEAKDSYKLIKEEKEYELLKKIVDFPKVIDDAASKRLPHKITNYINDLASSFHSFYNNHKVLDEDNVALSSERLSLLVATKTTLKNALNLIGVSAPEKM